MAIALVDAATGTTSAGTTVSATLPGGAPAAGRTLIVVPHGDATGQTLVSSDGLALREIDLRTGNGSTFYVYWRTCDGTEPATLTFRRADSGSDNFSLNVTVWSGVNKANPVGDPDSIVTAASDTATIPAFTTLLANVVVVTVLGIPSNTTVLTPPSGYTLASEIDGFNPGSSIYYVAQAVAGTTGNIVWVTAASATSLKGLAFALRPDPGYSYLTGIVDSGASVDNAGANGWANPGNIVTLGAGSSAACTVNGVTNQDFLDGTSVSELAAIPTGSTIKGFEFAVGPRLRSGGSAGDVRDGVVQLLVSGAAVGNNAARTTAWPSSDRKATLYGHPDDLWGLTPTVADAIAIGGRLSVRGVAAGADRNANVDCFILSVHYVPPVYAAAVAAEIEVTSGVTADYTAPVATSGLVASGSSRDRTRYHEADPWLRRDEEPERERESAPEPRAAPTPTTGEPEILATAPGEAELELQVALLLLGLLDGE